MRTLQAFLLRSSLLVAALMGPSTACLSAQNSAPALTLQGTVTRADFMHYRELPFTVPAGVTRVSAELSYTDKDKRTSIDLGAIDNERFRGWSGGNKSYFTISESDATASYLPGPVRPGVWKILLGIPSIREGVTSSYEVKIWFGHDGDPTDVSTFSREPMKPGPAWFRGDLHMHDGHSDGSCAAQSGKRVPCPLYRSVEAAAKRNLDFIAITDHNTTAHYDAMRELQPAFDQLLLIPGREITTFFGHMNVFGTSAPIDFRLSDTMPDFKTLLDRIDKLHAIVSVNHPASPTGESCMGCGWSVPNTDWSRIPAIEAVNGGNTGNRGGIPFWDDKLNLGNAKGFHLTGIGGGDNHNASAPAVLPSSIGYPTTVVYADNLSETAILAGIRAGHVFIDTRGEGHRSITWTAEAGSQHAMMGDTLSLHSGEKAHFKLTTSALRDAHAEVVVDGQHSPLANGMYTFTGDTTRHWVRINMLDANDDILVVGNPIYLEPAH